MAQITSNTTQSHVAITGLKVTIEEQRDRIQALDNEIVRLRVEIRDAQSESQHQVSRRDADLHQIQERLARAEAENVGLHQHVNMYKQEISKRMEIEGALNRNITERTFRWSRFQ